jgi:hypothetical protein
MDWGAAVRIADDTRMLRGMLSVFEQGLWTWPGHGLGWGAMDGVPVHGQLVSMECSLGEAGGIGVGKVTGD